MILFRLFARLARFKSERFTEADFWLDVLVHIGLVALLGWLVWLLLK
jgi:hypothetical protein